MKLNRLLVLAAAFVLGLSACNGPTKGDDISVSGIEGSDLSEVSEESSEEESSVEESSEDESYTDEGVTNGFPTQVVAKFVEEYGVSYTLPAVANEQTWNYEVGVDNSNYPTLDLWTEDNGEPGVDAIEDQYVTVLEDAGFEVDDSLYDYMGYVVWDEEEELLFYFYTFEGEFEIVAYGPQLPEKLYDSFPVEVLNKYFDKMGIAKVEIPSPVSEYQWRAGIDEDDAGVYFWAETQDDGAPSSDKLGENAIEDAYKATLENAGWTIDDTDYDESGYYATKGNIEINFFSWNGVFDIYIYPVE